MSREVRLPLHAFVAGRWPKICVATGVPTTEFIRGPVAERTPAATSIAYLLISPFVVVLQRKRTVRGSLPIALTAFHARRHRRLTVALPLGIAGLAVFIIGLVALAHAAIAVQALLAGVALVVAALVQRERAVAMPAHLDGEWIVVHDASDPFADEVDRWLAADAAVAAS